jgi:hypothetical protein
LNSTLVDKKDRFMPIAKGAGGSVDIEVYTKTFGYWLKHMLGQVATTGPTETTVYTHTGTVASLYSKSFTAQVGKPDNNDVVRPFTYEGGKVTSFELANSVDEILTAHIEMDFEAESVSGGGAYALQTPSFASNLELFTWAGGTITVGGVAVDLYDISIKVDNALKTDKYAIHKNTLKKEPRQDGKRVITWSMKLPYTDLAMYVDRIRAAIATDAMAQIVAKWEGPTLLGSTIFPTLEVTLPYARFDEGIPVVEGQELLEPTVSGVALTDGSTSPITVVYKTADVTP